MENHRLDQRLWTGYRGRRQSAARVGLIRTGPVDFPWRWPQSVRRGSSHIWQSAVSVLVSIVDVRYGAAPFGKAPVERDCDPADTRARRFPDLESGHLWALVMPASRGSDGPWPGRGVGTAAWVPGGTGSTCRKPSLDRAGTRLARSPLIASPVWRCDRRSGD